MKPIAWRVAFAVLLSTIAIPLRAQPQHAPPPAVPGTPVQPSAVLAYPDHLTAFGDVLFFSGYDASSGRELWASDGTSDGTALFVDIWPGAASSDPQHLVAVGHTLFFTADDGVHGRELWLSDGTQEGTRLVADAWIGENGSSPNEIVASGGRIYFTPWNDQVGRELWVTDGTPAGSRLVKDIVPGPQGGRPLHLYDVDGLLYFTATTPDTGFELWTSDGTPEGTQRVKDIAPGTLNTLPATFATLGDRIYFAANDQAQGHELWTSDGTSAGTHLVADIRPGPESSRPRMLTRIGDRIVFAADDGVHGEELWESDGTPEHTRMIGDLQPGPVGSSPHGFVELDSQLFFAASDLEHGIEPWISDGTTAGTRLVSDSYPGTDDNVPDHLLVMGSRVFYAGDDPAHGYELWQSDGTASGTRLLGDLRPGPEGSRPAALTALGNTFFFTAQDVTGVNRLWYSDGTPANTRMVVPPFEALRLDLSHTRLLETWRIQPHLFAEEDDRLTPIPSSLAEWTSSQPSVATYDPDLDRVVGHRAGTARITAAIGGLDASVDVHVDAPILPPAYETVHPYLAEAPSDAIHTVPVLIVRYLPTQNGIDLDVSKVPDFWWRHEITLDEKKAVIDRFDLHTKFMLEEGSRFRGYTTLRGDPGAGPIPPPSIGYRVVRYLTVYEQTPPSTEIYTVAGLPVYAVDVTQVMDRFGLQDLIEAEGIKEVWFWSSPFDAGFPTYIADPDFFDPADFRAMPESNMASPTTGDISNSWRVPDDLPILDHTYIVYGSNFRRTQAESVHNHGHQLEAMLRYAAWRQDGHDGLFWSDFVGVGANGHFTAGRAGWTHMPPNTVDHYDYGNPALVESDIEDWRPDATGARTLVNLDTWGTLPYDWPGTDPVPQRVESQWYIYWMQNMPGYGNTIPYGNAHMTNWWFLTAEWDAAMGTSPTFGLHGAEPALPVELVRFDGRYDDDRIHLTWETASESNNAGFSLERARDKDGPFAALVFVPGQGTTTDPQTYTYTDIALPAGATSVHYRLKQVDMDGRFAFAPTLTVAATPAQFALAPNYPNPFNPRTQIAYSIPVATHVRLAVYDLLGRELRVLVDEVQDAGRYAVEVDATGWASGQYLYRLQAGAFRDSGVMLLLR